MCSVKKVLIQSGIILSLALGFTQASMAKSLFSRGESKYAETEYGKTLPPIGFVKFCASNADDCKSKGLGTEALPMSQERWQALNAVNVSVNRKIAPVSDQDLYGQPEVWTYPVDAGDCEDYVLLKKRDLAELGFNPADLLITVVLDEKGEGHAVLTVSTTDGDYVLDNRRDNILRWDATNYKFLKRQSKADPLQWVALVKQDTKTTGFVASGN